MILVSSRSYHIASWLGSVFLPLMISGTDPDAVSPRCPGRPHIYESPFNAAKDDFEEFFWVQPIDPDLLTLVLEDWDIWNRWSDAFDRGEASQKTHPALPQDRTRQNVLQNLIGPASAPSPDTAANSGRAFAACAVAGTAWKSNGWGRSRPVKRTGKIHETHWKGRIARTGTIRSWKVGYEGASRDDLRLEFYSTDSAGHMGVEVHLGWRKPEGHVVQLKFGFSFEGVADGSCLQRFIFAPVFWILNPLLVEIISNRVFH